MPEHETPQDGSEILQNPEVLGAEIRAYTRGKMEQIDTEIADVQTWTMSVDVATLRRKDQQLDSLNTLKRELGQFRNFMLELLGQSLRPEEIIENE